MKVFNIIYTNKEYEGTAVVQSTCPYNAGVFLQSNGRLNSNRYKCHSIIEVGCNNSSMERIVSETYGVPKSDDTPSKPVVPPVPSTPVFDINTLTDEDIKKLKLRLDKMSNTLYVNRIGCVRRPKAEDGYSVLISSKENVEGNQNTFLHLFVKVNGKYVDYGIPFKFDYIESPSQRIKVGKIKYGSPYIMERTYLKKKRYGLFYLRRAKKGYTDKNKPKLRCKWCFIKEIDNAESPILSKMRLLAEANEFINQYPNKMTGSFYTGTNNRMAKYILAIGEIKKSHARCSTQIWPSSQANILKRCFHMKGTPIISVKIQKFIVN